MSYLWFFLFGIFIIFISFRRHLRFFPLLGVIIDRGESPAELGSIIVNEDELTYQREQVPVLHRKQRRRNITMAKRRTKTKRRPSYYRYSAEKKSVQQTPVSGVSGVSGYDTTKDTNQPQQVQETSRYKSAPLKSAQTHRLATLAAPGRLLRQAVRSPYIYQNLDPAKHVAYARRKFKEEMCDTVCVAVAILIILIVPVIMAVAHYYGLLVSETQKQTESTETVDTTTGAMSSFTRRTGRDRQTSVINTQYVCVHHVLAEGIPGNEGGYDASLFPVENCQLLVYCCAVLGSSLVPSPTPGQPGVFDRLLNRALFVPGLLPKLMIGDGLSHPLDSASLVGPLTGRALEEALTTWCLEHGYSGIFLRWPNARHRKNLIRLVRQLSAGFRRRGLTLGTVLPQDADGLQHLRLVQLSSNDSAVLLEPPKYSWRSYTSGKLSYYTSEVLQNISDITSLITHGSNRRSLCIMLPADTFIIQSPNRNRRRETRGSEVTPIRKSGSVAFFDTCATDDLAGSGKLSSMLPTSVPIGSRNSYLTVERLGSFVTHLRSQVGIGCMGIWNPHCDDFAGLCKQGPYPLSREVYKRLLEDDSRASETTQRALKSGSI